MGAARRTAGGDVARPAAADGRAAFVPEDLYRSADLLVHRLSAQREGFIDRTAPMGAPELSQFSRAGAEFDFAEIVSRSLAPLLRGEGWGEGQAYPRIPKMS